MNDHLVVAFGDGIGPEIMESALLVLMKANVEISVDTVEVGDIAYKKEWPYGLFPSSWQKIADNKAFLKAPTVKTPPNRKNLETALKKNLHIFINIRTSPGYLHKILPSAYDIVLITGSNQYISTEYKPTSDIIYTLDTTSRTELQKTCQYAFQYAKTHERKKISCFIQSDPSKMTNILLDSILKDIASEYKTIDFETITVADGIQALLQSPEYFDVIFIPDAYTNIEEIISKILGLTQMSCTTSIGSNGHGIFAPKHGIAGNLTGLGVANPSGMLNAAIQMLSFLGQTENAQIIQDALIKTLENGEHTSDIKPSNSKKQLNTKEFINAIITNLGLKPSYLPSKKIQPYGGLNFIPANLGNKYKETRVHIGYDVTVKWDFSDNFDKILQCKFGDGLVLEYILSMDTVVWPKSVYSSPGDCLVCRIFIDGSFGTDDSIGMSRCIAILNEQVEVIGIKKLYSYDGHDGFSE